MRTARCQAAAALLALTATASALVHLGSGRLAGPGSLRWSQVDSWYEAVGPEVAVAVILRLVAMAFTLWLGLAAGLQLLRSVPPLGRLGWLADHLSPRSLQRLGHGLAGLSLTAGLAAPAPSAGSLAAVTSVTPAEVTAAPPADAPPVPVAPPAVPVSPVASAPGTATMHLVVDEPPVAAPAAPAAAAPPADAGRVVVEPGDSLWSLAHDELHDRRGAAPEPRELARYWQRVIEANRRALVDPANPDLIYPGQVLTLPEP